MKKLQCGMVGAGSSATNIAATIATIDGVTLVAISDQYKPAARKLAGEYGVKVVLDDYKELCAMDELDFVIVSVPHGVHHEITMHALGCGKHVLVEKPIATTVQDAEEMISLAKEMNLNLGVHFQCRFFDAVQEAKALIDGGKLGRILQANISVMWYRDEDYYKKSNWRGTWKLEGGGSLINQAIHPVDEMVYLLGDVKKLVGFWDHKVHDIEVDDITAAAFQFESGAFGTLQTSTATKAAFPAKLTIFGSEGALEIDGNILTIHDSDGKATVIDYAAKAGGQVGSATDPRKFSLLAHGRMMQDFVDAINEGREPAVTGEDGLKSLKIVRAVYDSNGGKIIEL
ncbi:MAG: Gfo/Idh/MocA family protein [Promethearchaeota archaeon]